MYRLVTLLAVMAATGCVPELYTKGKKVNPNAPWVAPQNDWPLLQPPEDADCDEGFAVGNRLCDFRMEDQFGQEVSLWQFWGQVIVVDISTIWCAPCQELAAGTEAIYDEFKDDGFMYITVLQEDVHGNEVDQAELVEWADAFGISAPVVDDDEKQMGDAVQQGLYPAVLLIDRDMKVVERVTPAEDAVLHAAVEDMFH